MEVAQQQIAPSKAGSAVILLACGLSYLATQQEMASSEMATWIAYFWGGSIAISFLLDWKQGGLRNMIRVDVFALLSLYFLTFFEFLFPQTRFDLLVIPDDVVTAAQYMQLGLVAIVLGRHIAIGKGQLLNFITRVEMKQRDYLLIFFGSFFLSFLPQWLAVDFNLVEWVDQLMKPRFHQAWGRGRFGDLSALLHELQLLGYIVPPLGGVILARRKQYATAAVVFVVIALFVLYFAAFCGGTRNILGIQLAGLLGGYFIVQPRLRLLPLAIGVLVTGGVYVVLADMMLEFRTIGLARYVEERRFMPDYRAFAQTYAPVDDDAPETGYFVDYNLWRFSQMVSFFPELHPFLGLNVPFVAITKPIPRAFWPGKPEDLKVGLEEVIGAEGYTIAVTWIGEAYVAGGAFAILLTGLLIGMFCRFWNQLAANVHNAFPLIVFASGFFAILLLMRSLMFFTTALLPSFALIFLGVILYKRG